jgi:hypothetical protein
VLAPKDFPFDLDTTSAALVTLKNSKEHINTMLDDMLDFMNSEGIIMVRTRHVDLKNIVVLNTLSNVTHTDLF